jgi:RHS repeat-associated protein
VPIDPAGRARHGTGGRVAASRPSRLHPHRGDWHRRRHRFSGQPRDGRYCRARYYHPTFQRFIAEDPIGFGGGVNFFAYATNNPIRYVDPLGLFTVSLCIKGSASSGVSGGGGTCANFGNDRKEGMSFSITGTAGIGGGGIGATVGGSVAWSNAPTVLELNGLFAYGGLSGGPPGAVGGLYGFAGQGSRGTIAGAEMYGGFGVKLPNTLAPPVAVEGGVTTTSTIFGVSRKGFVFLQP